MENSFYFTFFHYKKNSSTSKSVQFYTYLFPKSRVIQLALSWLLLELLRLTLPILRLLLISGRLLLGNCISSSHWSSTDTLQLLNEFMNDVEYRDSDQIEEYNDSSKKLKLFCSKKYETINEHKDDKTHIVQSPTLCKHE